VLHAYLDESGKLKDPRETASAVGGIISSVDKLTDLEKRWKAVLSLPQFNVTQLHMNNLYSSTGEFDGWDEDKRRDFLDRLLTIMNDCCIKYLGAVVPLASFKALPQVAKAKLCDPYFVCLYDSMMLAGEVAKTLFDPPEYVEVICDRHPEFQPKALKVYGLCELHPVVGDRLAAIGFGRMDRVMPLQAADLVAHELLHAGRMIHDDETKIFDNSRRNLDRLIADKHCEFIFDYSADDLLSRVGG
jgi:hypothetical protein